MNARHQFAIRYGLFKPLLTAIGLGPGFSGVEIGGNRLIVKMGWAFTADLPRGAIASTERTEGWVGGIGVHGWRGRWLVNGAASGLVIIRLDPRQRARVMGFPVKLVALCLSLEEPDLFVSAIAAPR